MLVKEILRLEEAGIDRTFDNRISLVIPDYDRGSRTWIPIFMGMTGWLT